MKRSQIELREIRTLILALSRAKMSNDFRRPRHALTDPAKAPPGPSVSAHVAHLDKMHALAQALAFALKRRASDYRPWA